MSLHSIKESDGEDIESLVVYFINDQHVHIPNYHCKIQIIDYVHHLDRLHCLQPTIKFRSYLDHKKIWLNKRWSEVKLHGKKAATAKWYTEKCFPKCSV